MVVDFVNNEFYYKMSMFSKPAATQWEDLSTAEYKKR